MPASANGHARSVGNRSAVIDRILAVTGEEAERVGLDHIRMGEIAARAKVSRASLYRYFASKTELVRAYTLREIDAMFAACDRQRDDDFEARSAAMLGNSIVGLREHPVFGEVFALNDRDVLRSTLTSGEATAHARELVLERINGSVRAGEIELGQFESLVLGELLSRLVVSLASAPETIVRLETESDAREFAEQYLIPLIRAHAVERQPENESAAQPQRG